MNSRRRVYFAVFLGVAVALLSAASAAWACTRFVSQTLISGSATASVKKQGQNPVTIKSITADNIPGDGTGTDSYPPEGALFTLQASFEGTCCIAPVAVLNTAIPLRRNTSSPDLGPVDATFVLDRGKYWVCYYYSPNNLATNPATLTVN